MLILVPAGLKQTMGDLFSVSRYGIQVLPYVSPFLYAVIIRNGLPLNAGDALGIDRCREETMRKRHLRQIRNPVLGYGFAIAMAIVSVVWRYAMTPLVGSGYQYVTVFPLIIVVAILAGRGPAILHALLAGGLSTYFFSEVVNLPAVLVTLIVAVTGFVAGDMAQRLYNALNQARHRSEEVAQQESLIRSITQNTDVLISALDKDFRFIFLNEAYRRGWQQMWQQRIEIGTDLLEVTSPWPRQQRKGVALWNRAFRGETFRATVEFGPTEGEKRLFDIHFNPIYDAEGRQIGAAQIMRDITEQVRTEEEASKTELFYRQTLESIPGMVFTTLPNGYCDYQSRQWVEYTGVPMKDMLGSGWNDLLHPDDRKRALKAWRAAVQELGPYDLEYRVRRYDGLYEWFKVRGRPIRDASGTIVRWFGVATNINDLKKIEEALRDSESRFRGTFENAAAGITLVDLDGNWMDVNHTFCRMVGYTKEALIGTSFLILTLEEDVREDLRRYDAMKRGLLDSYTVEKRYRHKDGHIIWVDLYRALQRDETGKPLYSIAVAIDITERKRAEEALRESERRFRAVFEQSAMGMGRVRFEDARWVDVNDTFCSMLGYSRREMLSTPWPKITHPDDVDLDLVPFRKMSEGKLDSYSVEKRFVHKKGRFVWTRLTLSLVRDAQGRPDYEIAVIEDITDRKHVEEALVKSEQRLRKAFEIEMVGVLFFDLQGNFLDANDAFLRMIGYERQVLERGELNSAVVTLPEYMPQTLQAFDELRQTGRLAPYEKELIRPDGSRWWGLFAGTRLNENEAMEFVIDITDRKRAEESLRQSEEQFHSMFDRHYAVQMVIDPETGAIWDANNAAVEFYGYSRRQLCSMRIEDINQLSEDEVAAERQLAAAEKRNYFVFPHRLADGSVRTVEVYSTPVWIDGKPRLYSIIHDVTERRLAQEALRYSEERLRAVFDHVGVGIIEVEGADRIVNVNHQVCRIVQRTREQLLSMSVRELTWPEDRLLSDKMNQQIHTGERSALDYEKRYLRADGSPVWVHITVSPIRDSEGRWIRSVGTVEDISQRKQAEESLRKSERQFRELADSMPQIVWASRPDGVIDYFNRKWEEVTTGDLTKIGDDGWVPALHPDDVERVKDLWYESIRTGKPYQTELRLRVSNSSQFRWFMARALPIRDEQGQIVRWFGTATDIHDLKRVQESLKASERRYRTLFESIDEGFCIVQVTFDAQQKPVDYRFLEVNPAFERHTGLHAVQGQTIRSLVPGLEAHWYEIYGQVALTGKPARFVNEARTLDRWFNVYAFRVGEPHEHKVAILFSDITQFKRAEQNLLEYKDRLENKNREMESIIGIVSHDLRAPLVNIQGFSHEIEADCKALDTMLERVAVEKKVEQQLDKLLHHNIPESLQYVQTSAEAMNRLVVTLVETARAGTAPNRPERIDMDRLMADIVDNLKIKFDEADVSYSVEPLPECFADRTQVTQIFTNLLDNAVKYLHPDRQGAICVEGQQQADGVLYWVCDNGIGILQEEQAKIFEPYYQLKEKAAGGIGMGLSTVKKLVERNNGRIWVVSEKGKYSIFYIALPAVPHSV